MTDSSMIELRTYVSNALLGNWNQQATGLEQRFQEAYKKMEDEKDPSVARMSTCSFAPGSFSSGAYAGSVIDLEESEIERLKMELLVELLRVHRINRQLERGKLREAFNNDFLKLTTPAA